MSQSSYENISDTECLNTSKRPSTTIMQSPTSLTCFESRLRHADIDPQCMGRLWKFGNFLSTKPIESERGSAQHARARYVFEHPPSVPRIFPPNRTQSEVASSASQNSSRLHPASIARPYPSALGGKQCHSVFNHSRATTSVCSNSLHQPGASVATASSRRTPLPCNSSEVGRTSNYSGNVSGVNSVNRLYAPSPTGSDQRSISSNGSNISCAAGSNKTRGDEVLPDLSFPSQLQSEDQLQFPTDGGKRAEIERLVALERRLQQLIQSRSISPATPAKSPFKISRMFLSRMDTETVAEGPVLFPRTSPASFESGELLPPNYRPPLWRLLEERSLEGDASNSSVGEAPSGTLNEFSHEELYHLLQAVRNMLAIQGFSGIEPVPQRPFSWYVPSTLHSEETDRLSNASGSNASAPSASYLREASSATSGADLCFDLMLELGQDAAPSQQQASPLLLPPVLPAGFRNFSRYLDTKFGPDSSSVSLENLFEPQEDSNSELGYSQHQNIIHGSDGSIEKDILERPQSAIQVGASYGGSCYYSDSDSKSWRQATTSGPRASSEARTNQRRHGIKEATVAPGGPLAAGLCTTPSGVQFQSQIGIPKNRQPLQRSPMPASSPVVTTSEWGPPNTWLPTFATQPYPGAVAPSLMPEDIAWADYHMRSYWSQPHLPPFTWNGMHHAAHLPFVSPWMAFGDCYGWFPPGGFYGPRLPLSSSAHGFPMSPLLSQPRSPIFNPTADWFRAAANHFATAAMFADARLSPGYHSNFEGVDYVPHSNRENARPSPSVESAGGQSISRSPFIPTKMAASTPTFGIVQPNPQLLVNDARLQKIGDKIDIGHPERPGVTLRSSLESITHRRSACPSTSPPLSPVANFEPTRLSPERETRACKDTPKRGLDPVSAAAASARSFEELELPQDPALILPDQLEFYSRIKNLLDLDANSILPLPQGWSMGLSSTGRRFYTCERLRMTTWQHPIVGPRIPLGWERVERQPHCVYYRHTRKNLDFERQNWFFDLGKLQDSVSHFNKGSSQLIADYVDTMESREESQFPLIFREHQLFELNDLLQQLDCRFFRDLHRIVVAYELARIRIVRQLLLFRTV